jgi:hypothetical protein
MSGTEKSRALKISILVGLLQAAAIITYAISIGVLHLVQGTQGTTGSDVSPWFLIVTYFGFAALILWVVMKLNRGSGGARTPYLITQAFGLVIAQALVYGSETAEVIGAWVLIALSITGAIAILTPAASKNLSAFR